MKTYYDDGCRYFYDWSIKLWTICKIDNDGNQIGDADYAINRVQLMVRYPKFKFSEQTTK